MNNTSMKSINLRIDHAVGFIHPDILSACIKDAEKAFQALTNRTGAGREFLGWLDLPEQTSQAELDQIAKVVSRFQTLDAIVVIGIGGSYLGARAIMEALQHNFQSFLKNKQSHIFYAGQNLSEDYLSELVDVLDELSYGIIVISKSGTTTEPGIAFRILREHLAKQIGDDESAKRIVAVTDKEKGALKKMSDKTGYQTFVIPDDVGGRYSVLTAVGLLPIAASGIPIHELIGGAEAMKKRCMEKTDWKENPALAYAILRNALYRSGKHTEIMAVYNPKLQMFAEWWKQLYGESEGKEGKGIFPASVSFTTDLHSLGQYIQDGERFLFETILSVTSNERMLQIPSSLQNADGLNYLTGKRLEEVNKMAETGTMLAHLDGNVPNLILEIPKLTSYYLGQLIYLFEFACGISGYMLGVNPFDQPGVEAYKKNMFALLKKPGFESESEKIYNRLKSSSGSPVDSSQ
jgi:glucose-6-phosphate isomerase